MSREVSVELAYAEACQALGEAIVMQRLLSKEMNRMAEESGRQEPSDST